MRSAVHSPEERRALTARRAYAGVHCLDPWLASRQDGGHGEGPTQVERIVTAMEEVRTGDTRIERLRW